MQTKSFQITGTDDHSIPMYAWLPDAEPLLVVHIAHGMSEYAERYFPIAEMLVEQGFAVYAHDERAHGNDVANHDQLGVGEKDWFYNQVDDIHFIIEQLKKENPQKKVFLLGHSMGSFLAQRYFQLYGNEINGLILSASNGKKDPLLPFGIFLSWLQMKLFNQHSRSKLIDKLSFVQYNRAFKPNRTVADWLSRDKAEVDKYVADERCGFVCNATFFHYLFKGIDDAFKKENIRQIPKHIPVYAFSGDQDPIGFKGKGFMQLIDKWKAAGVKDLSYKLYPGGRHEMLNEINRDEVISDLVEWLTKHAM